MQISPKALEEFKALCKKHFNEDLTDQEAYERGGRLLRLCMAVWNHLRSQEEGPEEENIPKEKDNPSCGG
jgi:hypothetical protein